MSLSVSSPVGKSIKVQVFLTDESGTSCYSRKTAHAGETLSLTLDYGPRVCAHGPGVDFARIRKVGIKFFLPSAAGPAVFGPVSVRSFVISPPGVR